MVHDVEPQHHGNRLAGAPHGAPFRLPGWCREETFGRSRNQPIPDRRPADHIPATLAADIRALLTVGAPPSTANRCRPAIAVITENTSTAACYDADQAGIPAVYTGGSDIFDSEGVLRLAGLMEAFGHPHRPGVVRATATTMFFGKTAEDLALGGDSLTDSLSEPSRRNWADHARGRRRRGLRGGSRRMSERVLAWRGGGGT